MLKVLGISGSLRSDSYNRKVLQAAKKMATDLGAEVSEVDLKELNLPIYDGDIESAGIPEPVQKLKAAILAADVLLIASPEYNYSISGALKNAIDWASRQSNSLDGKFAAIFGVSIGSFGTLRGQYHLREILFALNVSVLPQPQVFIGPASDAFNPDGSLKNEKTSEHLKALIQKTLEAAQKLKK
ncbi:MAG: NAD(P)H-dependent oxidoreductase [Candidatus Wolfebacteria bacterium]|nr:NAD(P)H-dependent oxidoreductase [Candidatus Wolfebacteria bacterium]